MFSNNCLVFTNLAPHFNSYFFFFIAYIFLYFIFDYYAYSCFQCLKIDYAYNAN